MLGCPLQAYATLTWLSTRLWVTALHESLCRHWALTPFLGCLPMWTLHHATRALTVSAYLLSRGKNFFHQPRFQPTLGHFCCPLPLSTDTALLEPTEWLLD